MNFHSSSGKDIDLSAGRLRHRDNLVLMLYGGSALLFIVFAEYMAFYFGLAGQYGFLPLLFRALFYIVTTIFLWALLLRSSRRLVEKLMRENLKHYESILLAYDSALSLKDIYTGGHGRRVAYYAAMISEAMGLTPQEVEHIHQAALLHDIGKIGIPDKILTKPGKLSAEEFSVIQAHPDLGADIVYQISDLKELATIIRHHHEHFNGRGYPAQSSGVDIPFAARIIAVADALDALTSSRSYRQAISFPKALEEIKRCSGTYFDPSIVLIVSDEFFARKLENVQKQIFDFNAWSRKIPAFLFDKVPTNFPLIIAGILIFILSPITLVFAGEQQRPSRSFNFYWENDVIDNTDRDYTNGLKLTWSAALQDDESQSGPMRRWGSALINRLPFVKKSELDRGVAVSLGHRIYTPDTQYSEVVAEQRPYVGLLYTGFSFFAATSRQLTVWEFDLGVLGPLAMGEQVQNTFHDLINTSRAQGWDNQMDNSPILEVNLETKRRLWEWQSQTGFGASLITHVGGAIGNVIIYGHGGAEIRFGWRLLKDFGSCPIRPGCDINSIITLDEGLKEIQHSFSTHLFLYTDGQLVLHDLLLDGNIGNNEHWVDREPLVADVMLGIAINIRKLRVTYAHVLRTRRYKEQERDQVFGAFTFSYFY